MLTQCLSISQSICDISSFSDHVYAKSIISKSCSLSSLVLVTPRPRNKSGGGRFELGGGWRALLGLVVRGGVLKKEDGIT